MIRLASSYYHSEKDLVVSWYSEEIAEDLKNTELPTEILKVEKEKINYYKIQDNGK